MNPLIPIAQMLNDAGVATLGRNLFINMMPISVTNGILLRNQSTEPKLIMS